MTNEYLLEHMNDIEKMAKALSRGTRNYEDIRQEMWLAGLELPHAPTFAYAMKAMINKALDYLKSRRYYYSYGNAVPHISLDYIMAAAEPRRLGYGSSGAQLRGAAGAFLTYRESLSVFPWDEVDEETTVEIILEALDDGERLLLYNYFGRGETQGEIAEHDGVSRSMICKRLSNVIRKLRKVNYETSPSSRQDTPRALGRGGRTL